MLVIAGQEAQLLDREKAAIPRQQADHGGFSVLRRHDGDTHIDLRTRGPHPRGAILWQPALGNVEARKDLDPGDDGLRGNAARRRDVAQQAVDAHPHDQRGAGRLYVNVAGAQLHRRLEQIVDGSHDRRTARQVAQIVDIVVLRDDAARALNVRALVVPETLIERGCDILE